MSFFTLVPLWLYYSMFWGYKMLDFGVEMLFNHISLTIHGLLLG